MLELASLRKEDVALSPGCSISLSLSTFSHQNRVCELLTGPLAAAAARNSLVCLCASIKPL